MSNERDTSRTPTPDHAEHNAFFPSPYSLSQYTSARPTSTAPTTRPVQGRQEGADDRYRRTHILMQNGSMFSTGNHPVEMLLPMYHLDKAGFEFDVATLSGNPVKLEMWAMPGEDEAVKASTRSTQAESAAEARRPPGAGRRRRLAVRRGVRSRRPRRAGGHSAQPGGETAAQCLPRQDRYIITLCHGPACLLAPRSRSRRTTRSRATDLRVPDALDTGANLEIGYMPGPLPWLVGENLQARGEDPQQGHHRPGPPRPQAAHRRQPAGRGMARCPAPSGERRIDDRTERKL